MKKDSLHPNPSALDRELGIRGWLLIVIVATLLSGLCARVSGQSSEPSGNGNLTSPRHDDWRAQPKPFVQEETDPKQAALSRDRARYFDVSNVSGVPLDQPQPPAGGSTGSFHKEDELPFFPNEAIIVGSFQDYDVFLTPSKLSIYTNLKLSAEQVLQAGPTDITPEKTLDLLIGGGTGSLPDGRVISDHPYDPTGDYSLQPSHRYLLVLEYHSQGEFFTVHKDWELANGVAIPNRADEVARARSGWAKYSGLSESAFIEAVRQAIQSHQEGK